MGGNNGRAILLSLYVNTYQSVIRDSQTGSVVSSTYATVPAFVALDPQGIVITDNTAAAGYNYGPFSDKQINQGVGPGYFSDLNGTVNATVPEITVTVH
jgi:hypothetical protein